MSLYAEVVLSLPLDQTFSYIVPEEYRESAKIGSRVLVPFHQRLMTGFVVKLKKRISAKGLTIKEIQEVLDEYPVFSPPFLSFTRKLSGYYYSSWGELLQASLPPSFVPKSKTRIIMTQKGEDALQDESLAEEEKSMLNFLGKRAYSDIFLRKKFKMKSLPSLLLRLEKKGLIYIERDLKRSVSRQKRAVPASPTQLEMDFSLDRDSHRIAGLILDKMGKGVFSPHFLYGAPEKREAIYFDLMRNVLASKKKVLFLVPEISLTKALMEKFEKRLGENAALLHSRLSESMRAFEWRRIKAGDVDVVIGPRSALFSPIENLGLVIVDEEQDESYYQQTSPAYDARRGAWLRARQDASVLIYGSAVPSIEAFYRAKKKGYLLSLGTLPGRKRVEIVDERQEKTIISRKMRAKIAEMLNKKEPVLVFFNRRGYAPFLSCSRCDYIPRCTNCDIALTYHKKEEKLICHYCGYSLARMNDCPVCDKKIIRKKGFGIEVVEEELKKAFPAKRVESYNTDVVKNKKEQEKILSNFGKGRIDILVGTQLLAHRMDLPSVRLVIVLYPETVLSLSDFRASQKTFLSLNQMMKFLRSDADSCFLIQTAVPHHYSIHLAALDDYFSFYKEEIKYRRIMNYPPFSHMAEVMFQGEHLRTLARKSREFSASVKSLTEDIEILGPALALVSRMRGRNRVQVILKSRNKKTLDKVLKKSLKEIRLRKSIIVYE